MPRICGTEKQDIKEIKVAKKSKREEKKEKKKENLGILEEITAGNL